MTQTADQTGRPPVRARALAAVGAVLLLVGVTAVAAPHRNADAQAGQGSHPEVGLVISHKWCSGCHIVSGKPRKADADAIPAFSEIADNRRITVAYLTALLTSPQAHFSPRHGVMPAPPLTRAQVAHVISYIMSLRSGRK